MPPFLINRAHNYRISSVLKAEPKLLSPNYRYVFQRIDHAVNNLLVDTALRIRT